MIARCLLDRVNGVLRRSVRVFLIGRRKQSSLGLLGWRRNLNAIGHQLHPAGSTLSDPACEQQTSSFKLSASQTRLCQMYPDHMASVDTGVRLAADECRHQTEWRRWNCTTPSAPNSSFLDTVTGLGRYTHPNILDKKRHTHKRFSNY